MSIPKRPDTALQSSPSFSPLARHIVEQGCILLGLVPAAPQQQSFFVASERLATEQHLARVVDTLNRRFGKDTVYWGSYDPRRSWQRHHDPSWEFTTSSLSERTE